jgi:hypothetical protein
MGLFDELKRRKVIRMARLDLRLATLLKLPVGGKKDTAQ